MDLDLSHIRRLTDTTGILQHARYSIPNYHHGYCLDDNARALLLTAMAYQVRPSSGTTTLLTTYLAFVQYMQLENGRFRNLLSFDHRFLDAEGTEDSFGRTVWALGYFQKMKPYSRLSGPVRLGRELLLRALPHCKGLRSVRAVAYCLLGMIHSYEAAPDPELRNLIQQLTNYLLNEYRLCNGGADDWHWFEEVLAYDNAIIPYSLLRAGSLQDIPDFDDISKIAWESAAFLDRLLFEKGFLSTIGNSAWYVRNGRRSIFGQQPIEIPSLLLLYLQQFAITRDLHYRKRASQAFGWFFGQNETGDSLYDPVTKGCCDGLEKEGVNCNQGAESTISFWMAYLLTIREQAGDWSATLPATHQEPPSHKLKHNLTWHTE